MRVRGASKACSMAKVGCAGSTMWARTLQARPGHVSFSSLPSGSSSSRSSKVDLCETARAQIHGMIQAGERGRAEAVVKTNDAAGEREQQARCKRSAQHVTPTFSRQKNVSGAA